MHLRDYLASGSGRFATASLGLALGAAGLAVRSGIDGSSMVLITALIAVVAAGFLVAVGLAIPRFGLVAFAGILVLPPAAGLYLAGLQALAAASAAGGTVLIALGLAAMAIAGIGPGRLAPAPRRTLASQSH